MGVIRKYTRLSVMERKMINELMIKQLYFSLLIHFFPFSRLKPYLGIPGNEEDKATNEHDEQYLRLVLKNFWRVKKHLPFKMKCFAEALAVKSVLRKNQIPSTLLLGVKKEMDKLSAHAWLKQGEAIIIGKKAAKEYTPVGIFT